jgi:Fic family protein
MRWNWQQPDWPEFAYDPAKLRSCEDRFLHGAGAAAGAMAHLGQEDREGLTITLIAQEAVDSSAIEGELLDRASVQSAVARHLGIQADQRSASAAEDGAAELMVDVYRTYREPLSAAVLFRWHAMVMNGRRELADIGRYRTQEGPMQIVSGALHVPKVHFEAPPFGAVSTEMVAFLHWFAQSAPNGSTPVSALARAGIAHLWFESIHPFEDGNGRLGRAIAEKALAQGLDAPAVTALAQTIQRHRKGYYEALHRASLSNRVDDWPSWSRSGPCASRGCSSTRGII